VRNLHTRQKSLNRVGDISVYLNCVLNVFVSQIGLQRPCVVTFVRKRKTTRMSKHVGVSFESQLGFRARPFDHASEPSGRGSVELLFNFEAEERLGFFLMPGLYVSKKYPTDEPPKYQLTAAQVLHFAQCFADLADTISSQRTRLFPIEPNRAFLYSQVSKAKCRIPLSVAVAR